MKVLRPADRRGGSVAYPSLLNATFSYSCAVRERGRLCVIGVPFGALPEFRLCKAGHPEVPASWLLAPEMCLGGVR